MTEAIKITLLITTIVLLLYILDVRVVKDALTATTTFWNDATVYITTFKDRHPWIMLFMPIAVLILLWTMKGDLDAEL